jgi:hypothetical protein
VPRHEYVLFDPLFSDAGADGMVRVCERFGAYGMYSAENEGGAAEAATLPTAGAGARAREIIDEYIRFSPLAAA